MAKLNREHKLRKRRIDEQVRKDARKRAAAEQPPRDTMQPDAAIPLD